MELQRKSEDPDFWSDPAKAQTVMKRLSELREDVTSWQNLRVRVDDTLELTELGEENLHAELAAETERIQKEVDRREFQAMLSGPYDRG
ncbi:MAG TPA: PCRF domain-containing protein, partial [Anaerolineales bacterium]|nr:PCRF domain-containing protein [Anaerolineales bacterium]